jgi:hypothetical protein
MHPLGQIQALNRKIENLGADTDGVIECRIHQLARAQLLVDLYDYPIATVCEHHCLLSEAYALGG